MKEYQLCPKGLGELRSLKDGGKCRCRRILDGNQNSTNLVHKPLPRELAN